MGGDKEEKNVEGSGVKGRKGGCGLDVKLIN